MLSCEIFQAYDYHVVVFHFYTYILKVVFFYSNKMSDHKPISRKEFKTYLRIKELIEINGYKEDDLRNMI